MSTENLPALVVFDLDKTLARSKQAIMHDMAGALARLLQKTKVAVISGGMFEQLHDQVVLQLPPGAKLSNLYIAPTSGAALYTYTDDSWTRVYECTLPEAEAEQIEQVVEEVVAESGMVDENAKTYGPRIEYRTTQVTFSALGQAAPVEEKEAWDPTGEKKAALRAALGKALPQYSVHVGGATSIDITKPGIDKAYGIREMSEYSKIPISQMLYIGDALQEGGNDAVVKKTGIPVRATSGPDETLRIIQELLTP